MTHLPRSFSVLLCLGLAGVACFGQGSGSSDPGAGQSGAASSTSATAGAQPGSATGGADGKDADAKKKKVWTNEDVRTLSGPVSVVGNSKKSGGTGASGTADAQYIANTKKQLEKLQTQLDDTKKELAAYRDFEQGKAPEPAGYQLGKGYNREPVDQQIASLEAKQKQLEDKISDLLDEARKKGVQPGQLR